MVELLLGMLIAIRFVMLGYHLGRATNRDAAALENAVDRALQLHDVVVRLLIMASREPDAHE